MTIIAITIVFYSCYSDYLQFEELEHPSRGMTCSTLQGSWSFRGEGRRLQVLLDNPSGGALEILFNKDWALVKGELV